jgi:hypothetical protein
MADLFTQFSCLLHVATAENATAADLIRGELAAELDREEGASLGFDMEVDHHSGPGALWVYSDEYGDPEHVIRFVLRCAEAFSLSGKWGFSWSYTCSRPTLDGFGGGAHVLDLETGTTVADLDCNAFVETHVATLREEPRMGEHHGSTDLP